MARYLGKHRAKKNNTTNIETVELSKRDFTVRLIFVIILVLSGCFGIAVAISSLTKTETGWQIISLASNSSVNYGSEFVLKYNIGTTDEKANLEATNVSEIYTQACVDAYAYLNNDMPGEEYANLYDLNVSPNEVLTVSPALYEVLSLIDESDSRYIYLAPIYSSMTNLFTSDDDAIARTCDAYYDEELQAYCEMILGYASDPESVSIELLGENQVRLFVSDEYYAISEEYGIVDFIDFAYLQNAFACDFIADALIESGYTNGMLYSYDGYVRYLDDGLYIYTYSIYGSDDNSVFVAATGNISGTRAAVTFRSFPIEDLDGYNYYVYADGTKRSRFVSLSDGMCHTNLDYLFCTSAEQSCSKIALAAAPYYIEGDWTQECVTDLEEMGIYTLYCEGETVITNLPGE